MAKLQVATSIFPIYDITQHITGREADVFFMIPIHANPHTYQPVPSTVNQLRNSDLFIGVHRDLDGWIEDFLSESTVVVYLNEEMGEDTSHYRDPSLQKYENPHLWLTVKGAEACTQIIATQLASQDTVNRSIYLKQSQNYLQELDILDQRLSRLFETVQTKKMIQWHPAWDYFAEDYGLEIIGTIEHGHGDEPSLKAFQELIEIAKAQNVKTVVIGLTAQSSTVETLVKEINGSLIRLDSIGDPYDPKKSSYIKLMEYNAIQLAESFNP
ncbi:zinc ABC transporter substrate-binding protein [bacterium]|nr:zinc ABC transporter substrate-binding protein [bacterium]